MEEQKNRCTRELPGFEPRPSFEHDDLKPAPGDRRYSVSSSSLAARSVLSKQPLSEKFQRLKNQLKHARQDYLELRQEAINLKEYSSAKLDQVTGYLGVLADRTRKLDQAALETEARITPLINEKKKLFNDLLMTKGNIKVFCRSRPLFEDEGPSIVEFPDDFTICLNTSDESLSNSKKDFEFDRVYGPHVGQGELFHDIQPYIQSSMDGHNVSIFAYGQSHSGKSHTMEGSIHDRGLYLRSFEELFDISNSNLTSTSQYKFYVTAFELYNEQVQDLLAESRRSISKIQMGPPDFVMELVSEKVDNPLEFSRVLKAALQCRGTDSLKAMVSHLVVTIHISYNNWVTGECLYSKLSIVDLPASECLLTENVRGDHVTDFLHVSKSLSALGNVLSSLTSKKETIPYENSRLTRILADSLGDKSKTLLIVNICPNASNLSKTLSSLNFSARARNAELTLGSRDTIKKWRDAANDSQKELYEKEKEIQDLRQEIVGLKLALEDANDQCSMLFNEVQKAWKVSFTLQADLKAENIMLVEKQKSEKEETTQLRNQVAHLLKLERDQKIQINERDQTIQKQQVKIKSIESQLNEALHSSGVRSAIRSEVGSKGVFPIPKSGEDSAYSSVATKKLEEELSKRDALIEVSSPSAKKGVNIQAQDLSRNGDSKGRSLNVPLLPMPQDKVDSTALVKSGTEKGKMAPAGEYLTSALIEFDPDQFESFAAMVDGANKLLMLDGKHEPIGDKNQDAGHDQILLDAPDLTNFFETDMVFESKEAVINWCLEVGKQNNCVLVILTSKSKNEGGKGSVVELQCERGGKYVNKKGKGYQTKTGQKRHRETSTKKCQCPFRLRSTCINVGKWRLRVKCGYHNHELPKLLAGHAHVARLKKKKNDVLIKLTESGHS